jgi:hypothetical protein
MFLHSGAKTLPFVERVFLYFYVFNAPLANLRRVLGTHDIFLQARVKSITFVELNILVILHFRRFVGAAYNIFTMCLLWRHNMFLHFFW